MSHSQVNLRAHEVQKQEDTPWLWNSSRCHKKSNTGVSVLPQKMTPNIKKSLEEHLVSNLKWNIPYSEMTEAGRLFHTFPIFAFVNIQITRKHSSRMPTARLKTVHVSVSMVTTRWCSQEGGAQMKKFELISSDHHQMSLLGRGVPRSCLMSGGGGGVPHLTFPEGILPCDLSNDEFDVTSRLWTDRHL